MILDELLEFADALDVSAAAGTALAGDVIDLGATPHDLGAGQPMHLVIQVTTAFASGGSATVQFILASDDAAAIATDGSATEHFLSDTFAIADLVQGAVPVVAPLPTGIGTLTEYERYLGVLVVTGAATTTAGSINAFLTKDVARWKSYADAVN